MRKLLSIGLFAALCAFANPAQAQSPVACERLVDSEKKLTIERTTLGDPKACTDATITAIKDDRLGVAFKLESGTPKWTISDPGEEVDQDPELHLCTQVTLPSFSTAIKDASISAVLWQMKATCLPTAPPRTALRVVQVSAQKILQQKLGELCYGPASRGTCIEVTKLSQNGMQALFEMAGVAGLEWLMGQQKTDPI